MVVFRARRERRIRQTGGVKAPVYATNPFQGFPFFIRISSAQRDNRLLEFYDSLFDRATAESPNCVEVSFTGARRFIITREPEHVKAVLTSKFADFGKGKRFHEQWSPFLGDSIFTTDGQLWHDSRALIRPMFVKDRVRDLAIFDRWTGALLKEVSRQQNRRQVVGAPPEHVGTGPQTVDMMDLFYRMTLDVTTDFLLGAGVNSLENPRHEFARAFNEVQRIQMTITILGPFEALVPRARYNAGIRTIERFIMPYIERALALAPGEGGGQDGGLHPWDDEREKLVAPSHDGDTFLHHIARVTRDPRRIRDQIVAVLIAGRDTTAATLSWCVYELAGRPQVYAKLRGEVLAVVGRDDRPTYADLKAMTYLTHALLETLRLYPAVPYNIRAALVDTTLPGTGGRAPDVAVLEGDVVIYSALSMQRRADLYPPYYTPRPSTAGAQQQQQHQPQQHFVHPAVFCPERWDSWTPRPWQYVPFNGGPRICVGQNFAMTEMAFCLVRILQKYERLEYRGDWNAQFHKAEIVGTPGMGVPVALYEAEHGKMGA